MVNEQRPASRTARILSIVLVALLLLACVAVGVAAGTAPGCESCHFERAGFEAATKATAHADVRCADCHVSTGDRLARTKFGIYEVFGMWLPILDPSSSDVVLVKDEECLACHEKVTEGVTSAGGLRVKHQTCSKGRECVDCHSEVGHGKATSWAQVVSMNDCVACHKKSRAPLKCATCHTGRIEDKAFATAEFAVTHGPNWRKTHGMGEMSLCSVCHAPSKCAGCHGPGVPHAADFLTQHSAISQLPSAKCGGCHQKAFCYGCHQIEMPHPGTFAAKHSSIVAKDGDKNCLHCHAQSDCDECHVKHVHPGGAVGPIPAPDTGGN